MDLLLQGKRAFISGGSRGIGKAIARVLASEGVHCAIAARDPKGVDAAARELEAETGKRVHAFAFDTMDARTVTRAVDAAASALGGLDILVNCAARTMLAAGRESLDGTSDEIILRDLDEKVVGYLRVVRAALPHMLASGGGRILNISGSSARFGGFLAAGARNAAVVNISKTLAMELAPHGVRVNALLPGVTRNEAFEEKMGRQAAAKGLSVEEHVRSVEHRRSLGRIVDAAEVAAVAVFLVSPLAAPINGESIAVTGGEGTTVHY